MNSYVPETRKQKVDRLRKQAEDKLNNKEEKKGEKEVTIKYGLNHVTYLIEQKKAKLVLIANDVDPIETVVFLPTLCKTMDIPYAIVHNKSRLGKLVHKKTASCVALTDFKHNQADLNNLTRVLRETFNNSVPTWRSIILNIIYLEPEQGIKSQVRDRKLQKLLLAEESKKVIS